MFKYIVKQIDYCDILGGLLKNRNIKNIMDITCLGKDKLEPLENFSTIKEASDLFQKALINGWTTTILFDCDVDGYTSGSVMYQVCRQLGMKVNYIFHSGKEHGLDSKTMDCIKNNEIDFLIIPDAGSSDIEQIKELMFIGINVLILDHHKVEKKNLENNIYNTILKENNVECVIMNNQLEELIKDKSMTGVGIVYKFIKFLSKEIDGNIDCDKYLDLVALGMIGDVYDSTNLQSRYLVFRGLFEINNKLNYNKMISVIFKNKNIDGKTTQIGIAFNFVPMLNSLIRFGTREDKEMLINALSNQDQTLIDKSRGKGEVELSVYEYVYRRCEHYQRIQKKKIESAMREIHEQIKKYSLDNLPVIVCNGNGLDNVMSGLICGRISSEYKKPSLLLHSVLGDENQYFGSGRGYIYGKIANFNNFCMKTECFTMISGHENAFGVKIDKNKIPILFDYLRKLKYEDSTVEVDGVLTTNMITLGFVNSILKYDYLWGCGLSEPKFVVELCLDCNRISVSSNLNTISFYRNGLKYIMFKTPDKFIDLIYTKRFISCQMLIKFNKNKYGGIITKQAIIEDINY